MADFKSCSTYRSATKSTIIWSVRLGCKQRTTDPHRQKTFPRPYPAAQVRPRVGPPSCQLALLRPEPYEPASVFGTQIVRAEGAAFVSWPHHRDASCAPRR